MYVELTDTTTQPRIYIALTASSVSAGRDTIHIGNPEDIRPTASYAKATPWQRTQAENMAEHLRQIAAERAAAGHSGLAVSNDWTVTVLPD